MARKKRSLLPTITEHDLAQRPERLRQHAHGWAWKCAYCGQFASSETVTGKYVCRSHGGVTARQRDPEARDAARQSLKPVPRPPGRPMKTGWYSRQQQARVDEIVADYQERRLNADYTDDDMFYLRAYLQEACEQRPAMYVLKEQLQQLEQALVALNLGNKTQDQRAGLDLPDGGRELLKLMQETRRLWKMTKSHRKEIEQRHVRIICLSKVRAETRLKDSAAQQIDAFQVMLNRLKVILEEQLSPQDYAAFQARVARELAQVPKNLMTGSAGVKL